MSECGRIPRVAGVVEEDIGCALGVNAIAKGASHLPVSRLGIEVLVVKDLSSKCSNRGGKLLVGIKNQSDGLMKRIRGLFTLWWGIDIVACDLAQATEFTFYPKIVLKDLAVFSTAFQ